MLNRLLALAQLTVRDPKEGASVVLNFGPGRGQLYELAALVMILGVLLSEAVSALLPTAEPSSLDFLFSSPFKIFAIEFSVLAATIFATHTVGRRFGGKGSFDETLLLIVWLQFIMLLVQLIQFAALIVFPLMFSLIAIGSVLLYLWLLVNFISVLHGFTSLGAVFGAVVLTFFAFVIASAIGLSILGIIPLG